MNDSLFPLTLFAVILLLLLSAGFFIIGVSWLKRKKRLERGLNLALLLVRLPLAEIKEENLPQERIREQIGVMEQLYANFANLKSRGWFSARPWIAFELTVPAKDAELSFYAAVPKKFKDTAEKLIHAYYPTADVAEAPDYNIFSPAGHSAIAYARLAEDKVLPIKTYRELETDPLKTTASVFTKLDEVSEGAAIQVLFRPAAKRWRKALLSQADNYYQGKAKPPGVGGMLKEALVGSKKDPKKEAELPVVRSPLDENKARILEEKAGKPLFETNLRIVASAPTDERAETILQSLEQSFTQLASPNLNSLRFIRAKRSHQKEEIFEYSFRLFSQAHLMVLSAAELTSIFHFPNTPLDVPGLEIVKAKEASPPSDLPKTGTLLGYNLFRGVETEIRFGREDRRRHFYIVGQTGTGKSVFLKNLIVQDILAGEGVCVIDPHGELPEYALGFIPNERIDDVIYFDPGDIARPMGLNMLEYDARFPEQKTLLVNELLQIFEKLFNMSIAGGPQFEQYFRNAALLVMDDPASGNTLLEIRRVLADKEFRQMKLEKSQNILVKSFWTEVAEKAGGESSLANMVPYISSKFDGFLSNDIMRPIIVQQTSSFNFRDVMDQKKILLINLSKGRLGELNSSLLGLILVGKLLIAALSRTNASEETRPDFFLYIDEFHNVTTRSIATILSEARKYRLNLTMTHQYIGQLEEEIKKAVFGNVGSMASFRIGTEDGEFMEHQFAPEFSRRDLISLDNFKAYVRLLIAGKTSRPFSMRTYPAPKPDRERAEHIKEINRAKYGRSREAVEAEIMARHAKI
ncbi:MAG: type IV secretion system DNA-binding domain-containing protein [Candidatus Sungbacteria bacterium]|uniref:Type IV secretion system DNA-binding domain-containing protein n=1 Tax=Candidatus Sungiibacteriota bacterium TaxID=2750080 RepID=A0A9D6QUD8_9BACT|nr:type IV secretion system DNA-binding domain-containing protein [Candidatus Sungbacteria bacterium]